MIKQEQMVEVLKRYRGDAIVVTCASVSGPWAEISDQPGRDLPIAGALSKGSSVALGLALSQPNSKVIVLDADGSLEMNLGSLVTIAGKKPKNLVHFVMENGMYAITGGQPIPGADRVSFAGIADGAGYAASYEFNDLEEFSIQIEEILQQEGPIFVTIKTEPVIQNEPITRRVRSPRMRSTVNAMADLRKTLGTA